jgi:hypothetical protein
MAVHTARGVLTQRVVPASPGNSNSGTVLVQTVSDDDDEDEGTDVENQNPGEGRMSEALPTEHQQRRPTRRTISLAELEEERELARRRSSACVLLAMFVLFRLWMLNCVYFLINLTA